MNSLAKKSLFLCVLFIVCNFTLSNEVDVCLYNVHKVFVKGEWSGFHFEFAMIAFSEPFLNSMKNPEELKEHFESYDNAIYNFGNKTLNTMHGFVIHKLKYTSERRKEPNFRNFVLLPDYRNKGSYNTDLRSKQVDSVGYMRNLISNFELIAGKINEIAKSPSQFCDNRVDKSTCIVALSNMFELKDITRFEKMKANDAFRHCYLQYNYLDFIPKKFSLEVSSSGSSSSNGMHLDGSSNQVLIGIKIEYFKHMINVSKEIVEMYEYKGYKKYKNFRSIDEADDPIADIFPSLEEYCTNR